MSPFRGPFTRPWAPWAALAVLLLALATLIGVDLHASRAAIEAQERARLLQMAAMVDAHLSSRLQSTGSALDSIRHDWSDWWQPHRDMSGLNQRLQSMVAAMSGVRSVTVVGRDGDVIASNRLELLGQNVHQAERYQAMRQGRDPGLLYVSPPFLSLTGVYSLAVGKVVLDARGELLGYVSAVLDPDYFSVLLKPVLYAPDLRAALIHGDGQEVFRVPDIEQVAGLEVLRTPDPLFMRHRDGGQKTSLQQGVMASIGQHRLAVLSSVQPTATRANKSLVISISRQVAALYRDWQRELWIRLLLFAALATVASLGLLVIQWRQRAYAQLRSSHALESRQADARLRASEQRFRQLFEDTVQAVLLFENGRCSAANKAALRLHGMDQAGQWTGSTLAEQSPPLQPDGQPSLAKAAELARQAFEQGACECEWSFLRPDGSGFVAQLVVTLIHQGDQALLHIVCTDITEQKKARAQVEFLAYHDALTGLPNRLLGRDRLRHAVEIAKRQRNGLAVLYLDLDRFKHVNDSYGHAVGDALLRRVALRLGLCLRAEDTLCRLSGDEFMLILPELRRSEQVVQFCSRLLSELAAPFELAGMQLFTSFSIGVALHPQDGNDSETLMLNADTALYEAKQAGSNLYRVFEPDMNVKLQRYVETCEALRLALEQQQFELHYQPQIDLHSGQVLGVEALIRWHRPGHGLVAPGDFIGIAEESGLIVPIGRWVLHQACSQAARWQRAGLCPGRMAVNLSAAQFRQGVVERDVDSALEASGLDPAGLELELTESVLLQHDEPVMATLAQWSARGIRLAIDDFGTGYSSLAYLKRLRVDRLKIDRSFIAGLLHEDENQAIVRAMIQIAASLQLDTLAEGIEDPWVAERLKALGCDGVQGYWYCKPLPVAEFEQWWQRRPA